jgi:transposase
MNTRILGIDLGVTAQHKAVIFDPATAQYVGRPITFRAFPQEMDQLLTRAHSGTEQELHLVAVLEATGMAWYPVGTYLHQQGVTVYRINGRKTRDLRQVMWRHAGSDLIDSRVLTQLYPLIQKRLIQWLPPSGELLALQRACKAFDRYRRQDVACRNRINSYHQWAWGGLNGVVPTEAHPWMFAYWYNPWKVQTAGVSALQQAWQEACAASNPRSQADTAWIPRWVDRARQMTETFGSPDFVGYDDLQSDILDNLQWRRFCLDQQQRLSQQRILPLYRRLYPDSLLETIPGIGAESAATYMAFIQDIGRFPTVAQFRQWSGMVPSSKQSGEAQSKGLRLTQAGPNLIKATLYLNANVMRQWDVQLAAIYYKQMVDYGKHHTQAVCAAASHLANRIYAILTQQRPFQLHDEQDQPIDNLSARERVLSAYQVPEETRRRNTIRARKARKEQRSERRFARYNRT